MCYSFDLEIDGFLLEMDRCVFLPNLDRCVFLPNLDRCVFILMLIDRLKEENIGMKEYK
jgi:hypothetical protein